MAFFNEFPHTRTYDSDLGWIIREMKKLLVEWGNVEKAWEEFKNQFSDKLNENVSAILEQWLSDGTLEGVIYTLINNLYWITVTDFGVKNDGVTDNTSALQKAISQNGANKVIYFPPGKYVLNDTVYINRSTTIFGHNATIILKKNGIRIAANNVKIYGLTFDGSDSSSTGLLVNSNEFTNGHISNCVFNNCTTALTITGRYWTIDNCYFYKNDTAIFLLNALRCIVKGNYINTTNNYVGIILRESNYSIVANNVIVACYNFGIFAQNSKYVVIVGNNVESCKREAINAQDSSYILITDNNCEWFSNGEDFGISAYGTATSNCTAIKIINNIISGSEKAGIALAGNVNDSTIENNTLRSCRQNRLNQNNTNAQILVYAHDVGLKSSRCSIKSNTIYNDIANNITNIVISSMSDGWIINNITMPDNFIWL